MKISNLIKFVAVLAVCLNLASANSLEQIKKDGVIRMGTMGTYAPFTYHNEAGDLVGYDVEIAKAVADKLGLKPKFIEASWDAMIAAFDAGKADIVFNQVTINDDRKKKYDFTLPYTATHTIVIVHKDNEDIKSFADLKGKRSAHAVTSNEGKIAEQHGAVIITAAGIVKDTSLAASITMVDIFMVAQRIAARTFEPLLLYVLAALIYLAVCTALTWLQAKLEKFVSRYV